MIGLAKFAKASSIGTTSSTTQSVGPNNDVTGMGTGSVIHQMDTNAIMANRWWAGSESPGIGRNQSIIAHNDPIMAPLMRRFLSKESSRYSISSSKC